MVERETVLFRHRKSLRVGRVETMQAGKARIEAEKGRAFVVPEGNILLRTGRAAATRGEVDRFIREVEERAGALDLSELWELVRDETSPVSIGDLADLCLEDPESTVDRAALLWHLNSEDCPYFELEGERYRPLDAERVEAWKERADRHAREALEDADLIAWLAGEERAERPEPMTGRQKGWYDRIVGYVLHGDESPHATRAKEFLGRIPSMRGDVRRRAFRTLVRCGVYTKDEHLDLIRHDVPIGFGEEETQAAEVAMDRADGADAAVERLDLRGETVFSIDDATTTDIDDAFSLSRSDDGYRLGIHITELAGIVPPGGPLDRVARARVSSLYFPERKIPMLPPSLSEGAGSLLEGATRSALSLLVDLDAELSVRSTELRLSTIVNRHRLTYETVTGVLAGEPHPLAETIEVADRIAQRLRAKRLEAGGIEVHRPDLEIRVEDGEVRVEVKPNESPAQRLVSELMVLYNVEAARFCRDREVPIIYRAQRRPREIPDPELHPVLWRYRLLKATPPPDVGLATGAHEMLGVEAYAQLSSPLRRYIDLLLQRQVVSRITGAPLPLDGDGLEAVLHEAGERLRTLRRLEPDRRRYWLLRHLEQHAADEYRGVLLEPSDRIGQIELLEFPVRAAVTLHGPAEAGEEIRMRITQADPWDGTLRFGQL